MSNLLGKRLVCTECGNEIMCIKSGEGTVQCCHKVMEIKKPVALPTAD